ncbi:MAG TPA: glycosyltransferase [bacterium]|nr:glycosyltransferase [bacterium]HPR87756.1 glycosyltransferase [bacterium]
MSALPLVSVVIPTYNRATLLPAAIESVLGQSYGRLEILVVDDGSTDHTREVVRLYGDRVRYLAGEHRGPSAARNLGMRAATGEYLCFLDSDDAYYPCKVQAQVELMMAHPWIDMISTEIAAAFDHGEVKEYYLKKYFKNYNWDRWRYEDIYRHREEVLVESCGKTVEFYAGPVFDHVLLGPMIVTTTVLFKRRILDRIGYQNEAYRFAEEYEFILRMCKHSQVGFLNLPTYQVRFHEGQMSHFLIKRRKDQEEEDLLRTIEGVDVMVQAVKNWAYDDSAYFQTHRRWVEHRMAELYRCLGGLWLQYGNRGKAIKNFRLACRFEGRKLSGLRSWAMFYYHRTQEKAKTLVHRIRRKQSNTTHGPGVL